MPSCHTDDGVEIYYQFLQSPPQAKSDICIVLIHGFSGSSQYFVKNISDLAKEHSVVAYDLRGHGKSGNPNHGFHVARLAADLRVLVAHLQKAHPEINRFVGVGCSIGAAVLWSFVELFGDQTFMKMIFVDQAPLQNYTMDWGPDQGNYGCHDASSVAWNQANLIMDFENANKALVKACLGYRYEPRKADTISAQEAEHDEKFFTQISSQCTPTKLAKLMGDHTQYDHRDTIRHCIGVPCLVIAGQRSGCFPSKGTFETARLINTHFPGLAQESLYSSGHWLYYEEAARFNEELLVFIRSPNITA